MCFLSSLKYEYVDADSESLVLRSEAALSLLGVAMATKVTAGSIRHDAQEEDITIKNTDVSVLKKDD
jgi:hypothetical protein